MARRSGARKRKGTFAMTHARIASLLAVGIAAMIASGCMSDAERRQQRIEKNFTVFSQLAPEVQQRASAGTFAIGDPQSAVWFAWGEPDARSYGANANGSFEIWQYTRTVSEPYQVMVYDPPPPPPPPGAPPFRYIPTWHYETDYRYIRVPARQVDFTDGLVSQIQIF